VWLPTERIARIWQAFVSENPKTVIHFPMCEGHGNYGLPRPHGWHNSFMEAGVPFELVASGPLGDNLNVEYYAGLTKLKVLKGREFIIDVGQNRRLLTDLSSQSYQLPIPSPVLPDTGKISMRLFNLLASAFTRSISKSTWPPV